MDHVVVQIPRTKKSFTSSPFSSGKLIASSEPPLSLTHSIHHAWWARWKKSERFKSFGSGESIWNQRQNKFPQVFLLPYMGIWVFSRECLDYSIFTCPKYSGLNQTIRKATILSNGTKVTIVHQLLDCNCVVTVYVIFCCVSGIKSRREWVTGPRLPWPLSLDNKLYRASRAANSRQQIMTKETLIDPATVSIRLHTAY